MRPALRDHLGTRLELRLGEAADSEVDRKAAANIPADAPGRGLTQGPYHFLGALPRVDGVAEPGSLADGTAALVERVRGAWPGRSAPRVRNLPAVLPATDLPVGPTDLRDRIPLGIDEDRLAPVGLTFATEPHLVVLGDSRCGKTNLLRHIARQIDARNTVVPGLTTAAAPRVGWLIVVDFRRALLDVAGLPSVLKYVRNAEELTALVRDLKANLEQRLPGPDVTPAQLRGQSWWRGKAMFVLVDDYDLVAQSGANPLAPLSALLSQGSDIGFHLVVARRAAGSGRALHDQVIGPMRSIDAPALLMSGNRDEGALFGSLRPGPLPPGRGHLVRSSGVALIQTPLSEPDPE